MENFTLDPFQEEAIEYIKKGFSVVVSAPTGAGKTLIAEYVIKETLEKKEGVIYTAPIKALSNQKFRDFTEKYGKDKVGIITGDVSINSSAPVLIMTTEIFRNYILQTPKKLENKTWVIFDEIHYLDDTERGTVWEESIIFLPQHMNILALSATIPNIKELVKWIKKIHKKPVKEIIETHRPVPLNFYFQCQNEIFKNFKRLEKFLSNKQIYKFHKQNRVIDLIKHLKSTQRLPCIYFSFSRRRCENLAWELLRFDFLNPEEKKQIIKLYNSLLERFDLKGEKSAEMLFPLIKRGVAFHHAGMLPTLKEIIERLFTSRLIKVIFTTETFALGINMPARTVCFDEIVKFYGKYTRYLKTRDFYQMAGRAGRRGIDKRGFVYIRVNLHQVDIEVLKNIIWGKPEPVVSKFCASYATILNLYKHLKESLIKIYPLTFHYFQQKENRKRGQELLEAKLELLKNTGYIYKEALTLKGEFSSNLFGYELIFGELFEAGFLERLDWIELCILTMGVVCEAKPGLKFPKLSKKAKRIKEEVDKVINYIHKEEKRFKIFPLTKKAYFYLSEAVIRWCQKEDFDKVVKVSKIDEGELIRNFRLCIQVLREMNQQKIPQVLKKNINKALEVLNRDVVNAEKQLRS